MSTRRRAAPSAVLMALACGCVFVPPPPLAEEVDAAQTDRAARARALAAGKADPSPPAAGEGESAAAGERKTFKKGDESPVGMTPEQMRAYATAQGDPRGGDFPIEEALAGIEGNGALWVRFETGRGPIECELHEKQTPITIANFVGLARGLRPTLDRDKDEWGTRPYYDGTTFHRVIPGFMIQGGDPAGTGMGNPGYVIQDEFSPELQHDGPGVLSMANRGAGTGGGQFFITLGPAHHLDGKHTVFGKCNEPSLDIADDISMVPRGPDDRPNEPEVVTKVVVFRK